MATSSSPSSPNISGASTPIPVDQDIQTSSTILPSDGVKLPFRPLAGDETPRSSDAQLAGRTRPEEPDPKQALSRLLKGKEKEWAAVAEKKGPLRLLDLPVDILKEIIQQLPHTNDLTALALTHSALHRLAIPFIYARFDIVWPDAISDTETRTGVDALTYGLATLVMAEEVFGESPAQRAYKQRRAGRSGLYGGHDHSSNSPSDYPFPLPKRRRGNYYAQFTKKFSLGNGPADWVQEYLITKEGGKMLGTLVALAIARMRNLETFVWDMPTGILRDVWLALSSLADRDDGEDCRLERLWIRWHDNSHILRPIPAPPPLGSLGNLPPPPNTSGVGAVQAPIVVPIHHSAGTLSAIDRVENPTFSVIPGLKSLSVLDIDELPYLDEMSILIGRSQKRLRELRVGIARHAQQRDWVTAWDGEGVQQVDYNTTWTAASSIGDKRLGGVLGILVGRVYNLRNNGERKVPSLAELRALNLKKHNQNKSTTPVAAPETPQSAPDREHDSEHENAEAHTPSPLSPDPHKQSMNESEPVAPVLDAPADDDLPSPEDISTPVTGHGAVFPKRIPPQPVDPKVGPVLNTRLKLETLELERVPVSVSVMLKAFDWSMLTTLTLLNCNNHEQLWKSLRRTFSPASSQLSAAVASSSYGTPSKPQKSLHYSRSIEYKLNLKKIHTNTVSPALISFLKETLRPNSLEVLFLQEGRSYTSPVTVDAIFKGPLKRHKGSLKKLMIDSSEKDSDGHVTSNSRWKKWMLTREILTFITSGRMNSLKELAAIIDYHDWHFFLQRLPMIPQVRSIYIPHIADHVHGNNINSREIALQVVDIVHLRPEVEICYMGILNKCYEILENKPSNWDVRHDSISSGADDVPPPMNGYHPANDMPLSDDEGEETEEDEDDDEIDEEDTESEASFEAPGESDDDDSFMKEDEKKAPMMRLREILFYDDKVAIFKARHGKL